MISSRRGVRKLHDTRLGAGQSQAVRIQMRSRAIRSSEVPFQSLAIADGEQQRRDYGFPDRPRTGRMRDGKPVHSHTSSQCVLNLRPGRLKTWSLTSKAGYNKDEARAASGLGTFASRKRRAVSA